MSRWPQLSIAERFCAKVNRNGPTVRPELGPCWTWTAYLDRDGCGRIQVSGRSVHAHHLSWELNVGQISPGQWPLHRCKNPGCVRPDHLFLSTQVENMCNWTAMRQGALPFGENHWNSKLSKEQVSDIRRRYVPRMTSIRQLAAEFSVSKSTISDVLAGINRRRG
jgi:hypothetical protein